jgi:hypothetical protein
LTSALDGGEWSASRPGPLPPENVVVVVVVVVIIIIIIIIIIAGRSGF